MGAFLTNGSEHPTNGHGDLNSAGYSSSAIRVFPIATLSSGTSVVQRGVKPLTRADQRGRGGLTSEPGGSGAGRASLKDAMRRHGSGKHQSGRETVSTTVRATLCSDTHQEASIGRESR